jgi:hypothetical protein
MLRVVVVACIRFVNYVFTMVPAGITDVVFALTQAVIVDRNALIVYRIDAVVAAERLENVVDFSAYTSKSLIAKPALGIRLWRTPFVAEASRFCELADVLLGGCSLKNCGVEVTCSPLESHQNVSIECRIGV